MAGRFPFDPSRPGGGLPGGDRSNAQMRAALGLPSVDELSRSLYVDQQQRLEAQQRDLRYRHALYQDQLDHQLHELQMRANAAAEMEHSPELRQHYANLLLKERFARGAEAEQAAAAHQQQAAALLSYRQAVAAHEQHYGAHHGLAAQAAAAAQLRYQEEIRQHQQAAALQAHLRGAGVPGLDQLVMRPDGSNIPGHPYATEQIPPGGVASVDRGDEKLPARDHTHDREGDEVSPSDDRNLSRSSSVDSVEMEDMVIEQHKKQRPELLPLAGGTGKGESKKRRRKSSEDKSPSNAEAQSHSSKKKRGRPRKGQDGAASIMKKKDGSLNESEERMRAEAILQAMAERASGISHEVLEEPDEPPPAQSVERFHEPIAPRPKVLYVDGEQERYSISEASRVSAILRQEGSPMLNLGTIDNLLSAADSENKAFEGADVLTTFKNGVEWPESDEEEASKSRQEPRGLIMPKEPHNSIVTTMLESHFPKLPEEPLYNEADDDSGGEKQLEQLDIDKEEGKRAGSRGVDGVEDEKKKKTAGKKGKSSIKKGSNVLDYPYPVDTWWPSVAGRKRERRQAGEASDEDDFEEEEIQEGAEPHPFRVNELKIRERLETDIEPGVLEKLPHCRIHRLKRKTSPLAELVYCFQVTESYPNEMMVNCSVCGTWRHACCGGHYEPYSVRKNIEEPFVAVCEQCHEENKFISENPVAKQRIERQRMEQLRRGLSTTAVMRSMSFSKHGGTYKWPLGSVSATHVGGHTRSVQARHDKAEKQWTDLLTRLGRGYGYRAKERQRVRTKELERLLVAIEDAEGQTDRHNMLLFLTRDSKRPMPVGLEEERKNLFDPCHSDEAFDSRGYTSIARRPDKQGNLKSGDDEEVEQERPECMRPDCTNRSRFDSKFCCDGCGVHVMEVDLLRAFHESNDIHPSVLRSHY
eukprot:CAMPEP_0172446720 /NCGR_PEP_ID=MMETSP1065-20121228/6262_1 /TAXON_ID=265537 /ORGANISM="Amphiprora paludosa, Strain CCMP125" /LENGTH=923 /DNA_ID=CAMNT_0013197909 /DNA_START=63 /DNA_END=2834 /DNA_ORIENTATION=-